MSVRGVQVPPVTPALMVIAALLVAAATVTALWDYRDAPPEVKLAAAATPLLTLLAAWLALAASGAAKSYTRGG